MMHQRMATTLLGVITATAALVFGCGARTDDHATDTKTNWLTSCVGQDDCDDGLSCLCGVCTVTCDETASCATFGSEAGCFHAECANGGGVCALPETPLEASIPNVLPDGGSVDACPRPRDAYAALGEECNGLTVDCFGGARSFHDSCGCGCEPDPACDPDLTYVAYSGFCDTTDYDCAATEERFRDDCGCGCKPSEVSAPDCSHPAGSYVATLEECAMTDFDIDCPTGSSSFQDECGCGCEVAECDPTVYYVAYGDECRSVDITCLHGRPSVMDECGCGCRLSDLVCPRDEDAYLLRGADCDDGIVDCGPGTSNFRDDCGCGCEADPTCDPAVRYLNLGTCEEADFECELGEVGVTDECGCGCAPNPACDPDVEYKIYGGCAGATVVCDDGSRMVSDECGCGCLPESVDGGAAPSVCAAPDGLSFATDVLFQTTCTQDAYVHEVVASEQDLQQALAQCGVDLGSAPTYSGQPLYVATVAERTSAYHLYTVETEDGLHVGFEYPAYCGGARPPTLLLVLQVEGLTAESLVIEDVCNTGECSGPPPP